ncbi:hypothetical protein HII31_09078 [Pseudocercospora fuligena]|uniref:Uncharacterized protein n=1 Tax=Pseudocercospora fuligena TaxID=685502 RepID=A0A8H6REU0_9PEZI|nr:hypothetical protein HII31_09078 [Pseudocercospora fuligena]
MGNAVSYVNRMWRTSTAMENTWLTFPLPHTDNEDLVAGGYLALYNPAFPIGAEALLMHSVFYGLFAVLRGFSLRRMLDLHYLSIAFAFTFILLPINFLFNLYVDQTKLCFFLEHVLIELLIGVRVLAPAKFIAQKPGLILLLGWLALVAASVVVIGNHAALVVIGSAFISDFTVAVSGCVLMKRWWQNRHDPDYTGFNKRKLTAEAVSGLGFLLHGITTMTGGPLAALILYGNYRAEAFGIEWAFVFMTGLLAQGMQIPVAALFFSNLRCCCGRRSKVFPGQVDWRKVPPLDRDSITVRAMLKGMPNSEEFGIGLGVRVGES